MRKRFLLFVIIFAIGSVFFGQEASASTQQNDTENYETIIPENQHLVDMSANIRIEYSETKDEALVYYECLYITYDRGDAMNSTLQCLADFQDDRSYYGYKYLSNNKEKFFKDAKGHRYVQYISYVKFYR